MLCRARSAARAATFFVCLFAVSVLGAWPVHAFGELWWHERQQRGWAFEIGPYTNFLDYSPDISGSTNLGANDRTSVDNTLTAIGVDASLIFPLSAITGPGTAPGTQLIFGVRGGGFTGDWTAHLDLDQAIQGTDTRIDGELNGYARVVGGLRQNLWQDRAGGRVSVEVKGGGGIVDQEISGTSRVAETVQQIQNNPFLFNQQVINQTQIKEVRFKNSESRGFGFGEVGLNYSDFRIGGVRLSTSVGIGFMDLEDTSFQIRTPTGTTRIGIANDTDFYGYWNLAFKFGGGPAQISDARLKRDIRHVATRADGLRIYTFRYLWDDRVHAGVMAQDLLRNAHWRPAVSAMANGYYAVDYGRLGLKMVTLAP